MISDAHGGTILNPFVEPEVMHQSVHAEPEIKPMEYAGHVGQIERVGIRDFHMCYVVLTRSDMHLR